LSRFFKLLRYGSLPSPLAGHPWKSPVENFKGLKVFRSPAANADEAANSKARTNDATRRLFFIDGRNAFGGDVVAALQRNAIAAMMNVLARVIAPVHITLSLLCGEQKAESRPVKYWEIIADNCLATQKPLPGEAATADLRD
jgi:hypothetical protein